MKKPLMPIYYIIYFEELISCYLIKEGYIPCKDYRENPNDNYYGAYSREEFCIIDHTNTVNIFTNRKEAVEILRNKIEEGFNKKLRYLIEDRDRKLRALELK